MTMKTTDKQLTEELDRPVLAPDISPMLLKLDKFRITTDTEMAEEEFLLRIKGKPCFARRELTAVTGQAKSGKTLLVSMLMACCTKADVAPGLIGIERMRQQPLRVMWVDTEQSPQSTQDILKNRIGLLTGAPFPEEMFYVFNVRSAGVDERYELLAEGVEAYRPDLVIVDNVRDLVHDINDGAKAHQQIESLMALAAGHNCNVTCVLHQNRNSDNRGLRGWLGTELMNKVFEVFSCQKLRQKEGVKPTFCIEQSLTRKYDIDGNIYYQLDDGGLPVAGEKPAVASPEAHSPVNMATDKAETLNKDYIITHPDHPQQPWEWNLRKLFTDAMGSWTVRRDDDLRQRVMSLSHIAKRQYYEKVLDAAVDGGIIRRDLDRCGRIIMMLSPQ